MENPNHPINTKNIILFPRNTLFILVGPSGSGKSSFAKQNFIGTMIVSTDHCRAMIADSPRNQRVSEDAFFLFYCIIEARLKNKRTTIADSTALRPKYRRKLQEIAKKYQFTTALVFFDIPKEICMANDKNRRYVVGNEVLERQWVYLEQTRQELSKEQYDQKIVFQSLEEINQFQYAWALSVEPDNTCQ